MTGLIRKKSGLFILLVFITLGLGCAHADEVDSSLKDFPFSGEGRVHPQVLEQMRSEWMASAYFDRGMHTEGSRFRVVSLAELIRLYPPEEGWDAVLLECHDDYQGLISIDDIMHYDLRLALEMQLTPGMARPAWLNPMVVIVSDGNPAPPIERFMTANIRTLQFVRLTEYYGPLDDVALKSMNAPLGRQTFKDNCLFCHSLKGVGGNKGTALLQAYDFSDQGEGARFKKDFSAFHRKENRDKQDMEQFVDSQVMLDVLIFLGEVSGRN